MIKFDHQKVNFANSDRIEPSDPQFLTFRNNGQNNTDRSVFSQKVEMYKSIENNHHQDGSGQDGEQSEVKVVRNFKKSNNLRVLRSQERTSSRPYTPVRKLREEQLDRRQRLSQNTNLNNNNQKISTLPFESNYSNNSPIHNNNQYEFKNQLLRKKIQKLVKTITNQQRRQQSLQKDILELEQQLQQDQKQIQNQNSQIQELQSINYQNELYLNKLTKNYEQFQMKNDHLQQLVEKIEDSLENLLNSIRNQDSKFKMAQKLKEGIVKLESLKLEVTNRCLRIQSEIVKLKELIEQSQGLDFNIRDAAYSGRQAENSSHFTC